MKKKVAILMSTYNGEKYLKEQIESLLNQTYKNIEYIIVDGKSSDGTLAVVEKYKQDFDNRLIVVSEKDNGIYDAMNKGIDIASGQIIGIINSDDYYEVNAVEEIVNAYEADKSNPLSVYYGGTAMVRDGVINRIAYSNHEKLEEEMITHPSCFVTKQVYEQLGKFDLQYSCVADYDFMIRLKRSGKVSFIPLKKHISNFTMGGMSSTGKAYIDLIHLRMNYKMISKIDGNIRIFKARLAEWMQKHGMEPIRIRKR